MNRKAFILLLAGTIGTAIGKLSVKLVGSTAPDIRERHIGEDWFLGENGQSYEVTVGRSDGILYHATASTSEYASREKYDHAVSFYQATARAIYNAHA